MLRFNLYKNKWLNQVIRFQYILCYGSTFLYIVAIVKELSYFNTSYVTVQPVSSNAFQGCTAYFNTSYVTVQRKTGRPTDNPKTISIHPMLRFNLIIKPKHNIGFRISIHPMLRFNKRKWAL